MREGLREVYACDLQVGDLLFPTNRTVLEVRPSNDRRKVFVTTARNGRQTVGEWWRSTLIGVVDDFDIILSHN